MKVVTLTQPYASLIALLAKRIETRSWSTNYRGELAIHAGTGLNPVSGKRGFDALVEREPFCKVLKRAYGLYPDDAPIVREVLPFGAIVATCRLVDCVPTEWCERDPVFVLSGYKTEHYTSRPRIREKTVYVSPQEWEFGDYSDGRFAWLLEDIKPLYHEISCKGALGLWTPDADTQEQIRLYDLPTEEVTA